MKQWLGPLKNKASKLFNGNISKYKYNLNKIHRVSGVNYILSLMHNSLSEYTNVDKLCIKLLH